MNNQQKVIESLEAAMKWAQLNNPRLCKSAIIDALQHAGDWQMERILRDKLASNERREARV